MTKQILFSSIAVLLYSSLSFSQTQRLLSCNPPDGSGAQEIQIFEDKNKIFRRELKFSGSFSESFAVPKKDWDRKRLQWQNEFGESVEMVQVQTQDRTVWLFNLKSSSFSVFGECIE